MTDDVQRIRQALSDPVKVATALGLAKGMQRHGGYVLVCCPWHQERTPSLSLRSYPDGLGVTCHGCGESGDVLHLVARVKGTTSFPETLKAAAELAGVDLMPIAEPQRGPGSVFEPKTTQSLPRNENAPQSQPEVERTYPPQDEVLGLWGASTRVDQDEGALDMLSSRGLSAPEVARRDLARVIPSSGLPRWARFSGQDWQLSGHRLVLPVWDSQGGMVSLRAWRLNGEQPKRLPPAGHKASGAVLANGPAVEILRGNGHQMQVLFVEGEPDFLTWSTRWAGPVFGVGSGWWTTEHAKRIAWGATVAVRTHRDQAGDKYAAQIAETLQGRANIRRLK